MIKRIMPIKEEDSEISLPGQMPTLEAELGGVIDANRQAIQPPLQPSQSAATSSAAGLTAPALVAPGSPKSRSLLGRVQKAKAELGISEDESPEARQRRSKRIGSTFKDEQEAKQLQLDLAAVAAARGAATASTGAAADASGSFNYTGKEAADALERLEATFGSEAEAAAAMTAAKVAEEADKAERIAAGKGDDDMTDTEADLRDRIKECEEQQDYERKKRRELHQEVSVHAQVLSENENAMKALSHTAARLVDAVAKDESMWQNLAVMVKKRTMRMKEFYEKSHPLQAHLKAKPEIWTGIVTMSSTGPATTVIAKTKEDAQSIIDVMKAWSQTEGIAREVAIFRGKENVKRYREKPLIAMRNALSEQFGVTTEVGKRMACQPHWPEHYSPDWAISVGGAIIAWSEMQSDGFRMKVFLNMEHQLVCGQEEKMHNALVAADAECVESLYLCIFQFNKITPMAVVRGRGTDFANAGKGRGKGKGGKGVLAGPGFGTAPL